MPVIFEDGPAATLMISIKRTPVMLRVVFDRSKGTYNALDQLDDTPKESEEIHVYRIVPGTDSVGFVDGVKDGKRTGWREVFAKYRYWPDQPGDDHTQTTDAWRKWCTELQEKETS